MDINFTYILPEIILTFTAVIAIFLDLLIYQKRILALVCASGTAFALLFTLILVVNQTTGYSFNGIYVIDNFALFIKTVVLASTLIVLLASGNYVNRLKTFQGEYYSLTLFAALGMILLPSLTEFITIVIVLEIQTFSFIALTALSKETRSLEASLKFLLLSAVATCILLYGMSFIFGLTGSTFFSEIGSSLSNDFEGETKFLGVVGALLILGGLAFKIASFPFHTWVPDVYQTAPITTVAYLSVASKAVGFALIIRFFYVVFGEQLNIINWTTIIICLSLASMVYGNFVAMSQQNLKRMLGYSSIAHAGYLMISLALIGIPGAIEASGSSILFYLTAYAATNLAAFIAIALLAQFSDSEKISDLEGLGARLPLIAVGLTVSLVSLIGLPPTGLFFGKIYIFFAALENGYWWLALAGVLNSFVSAYYYLRPVRLMFKASENDSAEYESTSKSNVLGNASLVFSASLVILLGVLPFWVYNLAEKAIISLG
ncbi:MAG: NADH-quinone oxidoreductase subunit N [Dehalococcoidia bacterium]